jgi:ribosome-associated protein
MKSAPKSAPMSSNKSAHLTRAPAAAAGKSDSKNETAAKRDVGKLTKAIVDGLEDVKAQNLMVFDTEHLSSLFERVIVASGTSNRQTKALSMSVREAVSEAGFPKPRTEGEDNGEWIIVDCGAAVAHIMQPAIRQYYNLEEIWGGKAVNVKLGAGAGVAAKHGLPKAAESKAKRHAVTQHAAKATAPKKTAPKKTAAKKTVARTSTGKKPVVKTTAAKKAAPRAPSVRKPSPPRRKA